MNYLIDTNIISEVAKGKRCDVNVSEWYASIRSSDLYLSVLVLGEIRKGVERARPNNAPYAASLETSLGKVRQAFNGRILAVDEAVSDEWGRMSARRPLPGADGLLAATAKVHRMTFVTRNVAEVADLGANILNPFEDPSSRGALS
jgi:predicted nucleic acid-binding protein